MGKTFAYEIPYPELEDPANIPNDLKELAETVDSSIQISKIEELFYDSTASYVSGTLNDDITNYDMIVIIGQSSDGYQCSTVIYKPYVGAKIGLTAPQIVSTTIYNKQAVFEFTSATVIASIQNYQLQGNTSVASGNYIRLKSVIGIKLRPTIKDLDIELGTGGSSETIN